LIYPNYPNQISFILSTVERYRHYANIVCSKTEIYCLIAFVFFLSFFSFLFYFLCQFLVRVRSGQTKRSRLPLPFIFTCYFHILTNLQSTRIDIFFYLLLWLLLLLLLLLISSDFISLCYSQVNFE
jgi:hypothetical protein